jgi:RimJ/RimL family protein N-acetyltransferase
MSAKFEVVGDRPRAREFLEQFFQFVPVADEQGIVCLRDGEVIAAAMFYQFNGSNIWMHHASKPGRKSLTRSFVSACFRYPFLQLHANRISLWVNADNHDSVRFVEHLGFVREGVLEQAAKNGEDVLIYRMFRKDCRYV